MKKSILSLLLVLTLCTFLFTACTGTTPDVAIEEAKAAVTLENLDWTIVIEGAEKTEYTLADVKTHELSHTITTCRLRGVGANHSAPQSFRVDGITLQELLADIGAAGATNITYYGNDVYEDEVVYTLTPEEAQSDELLIAWISNLENVLPTSPNYVGIFSPSSSSFESCISISKIVIG